MNRTIETAIMLMLLAGSAVARPAEYPGPYYADVVKVLDADTLRAEVKLWPAIQTLATIRLRGVDTPEKGFRARCKAERDAAERATRYVRNLVRRHRRIRLRDIRLGKYAGRVVATVEVRDWRGRWQPLAELLIRRGLGRPYDGGKRQPWCPWPKSVGKGDRLR